MLPWVPGHLCCYRRVERDTGNTAVCLTESLEMCRVADDVVNHVLESRDWITWPTQQAGVCHVTWYSPSLVPVHNGGKSGMDV